MQKEKTSNNIHRRTKPLRLKPWVWGAIIVALLVYGYFSIFYNADVLRIENGKVVGAKPSWLIGHFAEGGSEARYYKVADVNAPKNYTADREAEDPDGDPITTFFVFVGKDAEKNPGRITVEAVGESAKAAAEAAGGTFLAAKEGEGSLPAHWVAESGEDSRVLFLESPYPEACIRVIVEKTGEMTGEDMMALGETALAKVVPGKQLSAAAADFKLNFLDDNRWTYLTNGLGVTLMITLGAVLLGIVLGVLVATVRSTWEQLNERMHPGLGRGILSFINEVCNVYLTVIRGTPVVIQLMIMYYIVFSSSRNGELIAMLAFGINSGAYVAEIIRGGIMSIDKGQMEAGRSLGFNYIQTMWHIIIPQAMKNVLPALANEFIVLLKETSVAGYVAVKDLTKGGDIIRGVTYSAFLPLLAVAAVYLVLVMFFTRLVARLERRLRTSDH